MSSCMTRFPLEVHQGRRQGVLVFQAERLSERTLNACMIVLCLVFEEPWGEGALG